MPIVTSKHTAANIAAIEVASVVVLEDKNAGSIHLQFYLRLCEQQKSDLTKYKLGPYRKVKRSKSCFNLHYSLK